MVEKFLLGVVGFVSLLVTAWNIWGYSAFIIAAVQGHPLSADAQITQLIAFPGYTQFAEFIALLCVMCLGFLAVCGELEKITKRP
jgi:hypothetical protein